MPSVDFVVETKLEATPRVKQLSGMFDVPAREKLAHHWKGDVPIDARPWNIGLIVGPSGAGKSSCARQLFGEEPTFPWARGSVIDDFDPRFTIQDVADICSAVGFNTIPSWMKPFNVLSTGEKFRVDLARRLLEGGELVLVDEFTSVVDRQVAHIGCHAVQKFIRKHGRKFVAVTCHYDVVEWLQPDWMLEPATMTFQWRSVQRRPPLDVEISRVNHSAWELFAPFHYLTGDLHRGAACFVLFVNGYPASFAGVLHRPHPKSDDVKGVSRLVTLPDFQGLGLAMILVDALGAAYKAIGYRLHTYPAHPSLVRAFDKSTRWAMLKRPGKFSPAPAASSSIMKDSPSRRPPHLEKSTLDSTNPDAAKKWQMGGRPCATFAYAGDASMSTGEAAALISGKAEAAA